MKTRVLLVLVASAVVLAPDGRGQRVSSTSPSNGSAFGLGASAGVRSGPVLQNAAQRWQYSLLPDSRLTDDCPICDRLSLPVPMRGTFQVRLVEENPIFATYAWEDICWTATTPDGLTYKVSGKGTFVFGGEVALRQELALELCISDGTSNQLCWLTNISGGIERAWPMIKISALQTNGTEAHQFLLDIVAAPVREVWFSTRNYFHAKIWAAPTNLVSAGDLISSVGRIVKRNQELTAAFVIMPPVPDLGFDAVDVLPGGEIAFSIGQDVFSGTAGTLHHGDVLSDRGRVLARYTGLIGAFTPEPPPADEGLDALQVLDSGEIYFSVVTDFFSESLGRQIQKGDLLSSTGTLVKKNAELIARFNPQDGKQDYGLDAVHVWPSGEIWFSVEIGFYGQHFEFYAAGDLLSDQGYVVCQNKDLLEAFVTVETLADFGLDALFLVTDVRAPGSATAAATCRRVGLAGPGGNITFQWDNPGRLSQLEKATNVTGPWLPISPILTEPPGMDAGAIGNSQEGYYRLRQW